VAATAGHRHARCTFQTCRCCPRNPAVRLGGGALITALPTTSQQAWSTHLDRKGRVVALKTSYNEKENGVGGGISDLGGGLGGNNPKLLQFHRSKITCGNGTAKTDIFLSPCSRLQEMISPHCPRRGAQRSRRLPSPPSATPPRHPAPPPPSPLQAPPEGLGAPTTSRPLGAWVSVRTGPRRPPGIPSGNPPRRRNRPPPGEASRRL